MMPLDGWPAPPDLAPPADPSPGLVLAILAIAFVCVVVVLALGEYADVLDERFTRQEDERRQRMRRLERACAEEIAEHCREALIDASPGGRKAWQEREK